MAKIIKMPVLTDIMQELYSSIGANFKKRTSNLMIFSVIIIFTECKQDYKRYNLNLIIDNDLEISPENGQNHQKDNDYGRNNQFFFRPILSGDDLKKKRNTEMT